MYNFEKNSPAILYGYDEYIEIQKKSWECRASENNYAGLETEASSVLFSINFNFPCPLAIYLKLCIN